MVWAVVMSRRILIHSSQDLMFQLHWLQPTLIYFYDYCNLSQSQLSICWLCLPHKNFLDLNMISHKGLMRREFLLILKSLNLQKIISS